MWLVDYGKIIRGSCPFEMVYCIVGKSVGVVMFLGERRESNEADAMMKSAKFLALADC